MTNISLSSIEIAKLTAIFTGGGFKRAATKEAALKRFFAVAAEHGFGPEAVMFLDAADPRAAIEKALADKAAPEARKTSPGLARLRASKSAETIRSSTNAEADAARAAVVAGMPNARKAALELGKEPEAKPAKVAKPKAVKAAKPEGATSRTKIAQDAVIATVAANPKKAGSRAHARFELYRAGATVQEFVAACVAAGFPASEANADISWDRRKGFITITEAKVAKAA